MWNVDADEQVAEVPVHTSSISLYFIKLSGIDFDYFLPMSSELLVIQTTVGRLSY